MSIFDTVREELASAQADNVTRTATGFGGVMDLLATGGDHRAIGSGPLSNALSILSGIKTGFTHDSATSGPAGVAEQVAVGATDAAFGLLGGPLAVADAVTGGNISGVMQSGVSGAFAAGEALLTRDTEAMSNFSDAAMSGDHGWATKQLARAGDHMGLDGLTSMGTGTPAPLLNIGLDRLLNHGYPLTFDAKWIARDGERELERGGLLRRPELLEANEG